MAIIGGIVNSFKSEVLQGLHDFTLSTGDVFKIALYTSSASLGPSTTAYTATGEASGTGYTAGGATLTNVTPTLSLRVGITDFANPTWTTSTITARAALIYNSTNSNRAVAVLNFNSDKTSSASTFTVVMPTADSLNAIVRVT